MEIDKHESQVEEKWVHDSSFDHKGRLPQRATTGTWRAAVYIIGIEFSERLSYFGIATSLIVYLTRVLHQDLKTAVRNVNYWSGVTTLMPLVGGFVADAYLGRFSTVLASSFVYLMGLFLLTMSQVVPELKPCENGVVCHEPRRIHEVMFFLGIYLVSVGTGGHKPALESFGADQFDDDHPAERKKKMSFFNWWNFGLCCGLLLGVTVVVYIQDHVGWAAGDVILSAVMAVSVVVFVIGRPVYRFRKATGSPLTPLFQVLVAAVANRNLPYPGGADQLHEDAKPGRRLLHTERLRFLDKAAIVRDGERSTPEGANPWKVATVTRVEEMKLMVNMIPIWLTTIPFGICVAQAATFFIKQGMTLNRRVGRGFVIPPASIFALAAVGMILSVTMYDRLLVPLLRRVTRNERGISILQRVGFGMVFSVLTMAVAALVERRRLNAVARDPNAAASMSVFWLAPQFLIIGIGDGFTLVGLQEYFYDQAPDAMRSLGIALYLSVIGAANFVSSLLITAVDRATATNWGGGRSWFGKDLNSSRLDYFYWLLAGMTAVNLCIYVLVARRYQYKNVGRPGAAAVADCYDGDGVGTMA